MSLGPLRSGTRRRQRPRILLCTPEVTELPEGKGNASQYIRAKGGGLGDISAGLIRHLKESGRYDIHVAIPKYDAKIRDLGAITVRELDLLSRILDRQGIHLVSDSAFSFLKEVYGEGNDSLPRLRRSLALQRHIINYLLPSLEPDLVHCNDWMTGLVPAAARARGIASVFTLHNIFSEMAPQRDIDASGIDVRQFSEHLYFSRYPTGRADEWVTNKVDFTATGIHAADHVNTVSSTFLRELVSGEFADIVPSSIRHSMHAKFASGQASGILNAPGELIDPRLHPAVIEYDSDDVIEKKRENKARFQKNVGLRVDVEAPLFFWPHRIYAQKSPETLASIAENLVQRHGLQIALVANGEPELVTRFRRMAAANEGRIVYRPFREELSVQGMAASDFMLMPSRYEPCGLPQMEAPRFGTVPVARLTGGIKDTVASFNEDASTGNGFAFEPATSTALAGAIDAAVEFYRRGEDFRRPVLQRIMAEAFERFSLVNTAKDYISVYDSLLDFP